jgi:transposase
MGDMGIASQEVRKRAIAACEAGGVSQSQVASLYGVDISTLERWLQRYRRTGQTAPLPRGHRRAVYEGQDAEHLDALITQAPDLTLEELREATGKICSIMAVQRATRRLDWHFKKSRYTRASKPDPM